MNKSIKKYIYAILGGIMPAVLFVACASEDSEPQDIAGTPLEFIANGLGLNISVEGTISSRTAWLEVDTGGVAIQANGALRKYIVSDTLDNASIALLTSSNPFIVKPGGKIEVIGRFPNRYYPVGDTIMWTTCHSSTISDDLMLAYSNDIGRDGRKLDFYHTQVKVVVNIRNTPYIKNLYQYCWHVLLRDIDQTAEYTVNKSDKKITLDLIKSYNTKYKTH